VHESFRELLTLRRLESRHGAVFIVAYVITTNCAIFTNVTEVLTNTLAQTRWICLFHVKEKHWTSLHSSYLLPARLHNQEARGLLMNRGRLFGLTMQSQITT